VGGTADQHSTAASGMASRLKHGMHAGLSLCNYSCSLLCRQRLYHIKASCDRLKDSRFEGSMAGILQLGIDGAMVHQGHCCGVNELG
jgi:hypothetical protein